MFSGLHVNHPKKNVMRYRELSWVPNFTTTVSGSLVKCTYIG